MKISLNIWKVQEAFKQLIKKQKRYFGKINFKNMLNLVISSSLYYFSFNLCSIIYSKIYFSWKNPTRPDPLSFF